MRVESRSSILSFPIFLLGESPSLSGVASNVQPEPRKINDKLKYIFVIDDESHIADSLVEILNGCGYHAYAFYDGRAAIDFARQRCPDIVVSDVIMPKLNGVDTAIMIREHCPATRIVLFSGQAGTAAIMDEARIKGHNFELLPKPMHPDQLLKRLSALK